MVVDSHRLDQEQNLDPDPHESEKLDFKLDVGWAITSVEVKTDKVITDRHKAHYKF